MRQVWSHCHVKSKKRHSEADFYDHPGVRTTVPLAFAADLDWHETDSLHSYYICWTVCDKRLQADISVPTKRLSSGTPCAIDRVPKVWCSNRGSGKRADDFEKSDDSKLEPQKQLFRTQNSESRSGLTLTN